MKYKAVGGNLEIIRMSSENSTNNEELGIVTREGILRLMKSRDEIDEQITALGGILQSVSCATLL